MIFYNKKAFTLIELIISITIFFILVMMTYLPYNFFMNKQKVRNTTKEISQSLYEARNMAINWLSNDSNKSVWIYFDNTKENLIQFFSYPHTFTWSDIKNQLTTDIELIKSYKLIEWMWIKNINGKDNWLFFFDAITWKWKYYTFNNMWIKEDFTWNEIEINFSYKNASIWSSLSWKIKYFINTNIVDY